MLLDRTSLSIQIADYDNINHNFHIISLINEYRCDQMGGKIGKLPNSAEQILIDSLKNHPSSIVYFVQNNKAIIGMAICFIGFSTFKVKYLLNIHDLIIYNQFRSKGIGSYLLKKISEDALNKGYCRLTLEVRIDNHIAKKLYTGSGFKSCDNPMEFWIKDL